MRVGVTRFGLREMGPGGIELRNDVLSGFGGRARTVRVAVFVLMTALASPRTGLADDIRCHGRLVGAGDTAFELRARCGEPDYREVRPVLRAEGFVSPQTTVVQNPQGQRTLVANSEFRSVRYVREQVELWTYIGDRGDLARLVTLRQGRVERVQTLGKLDIPDDPGCERALFERGARLGSVHLGCGEPDDRVVWEEEEHLEVGGLLRRRLIVRERWTYNPGRGHLIRILTFENGRLVDTTTAGRAP